MRNTVDSHRIVDWRASLVVVKRANIPVERTRSVRVSPLAGVSLYRRSSAVRVPRHCQFSATRLWIVTKDVPNATSNSVVYEKVRVTHERREAVVRVCVRKHVLTRVRRSKAHTRETQFKPKERAAAVAAVLWLSYTTHWVARVSVRRS